MQTHNTHVAKTVIGVLSGTDPAARTILDRSTPLREDFLQALLAGPSFGISGRRPRARLNKKGDPRPTDMDLASFLVELAKAPQSVIELPAYSTALPRAIDETVTNLSERRYGQLLGLSSHRDHFSFGVTLEDVSLMQRSSLEADSIGAPRTFLILDHNGYWHEGWRGIGWQPKKVERAFRERFDLLEDPYHKGYQYFVHPKRVWSIYSRAHLLLKLCHERLVEESEARTKSHQSGHESPAALTAAGKPEIRTTFTMKLYGLKWTGEFQSTPLTVSEAMYYSWYERTMQFFVRANEYAWYQYGLKDKVVATWIKGLSWDIPHSDKYQEAGWLHLPHRTSLSFRKDIIVKTVKAR